MIVLIIVINRFTRGFVKALSLFLTMVIGYLVAAAFGLISMDSVTKAGWVEVPKAVSIRQTSSGRASSASSP